MNRGVPQPKEAPKVTTKILSGAVKRCTDCGGEGIIYLYRHVADGPLATETTPSALCGGTGWLPVIGQHVDVRA